jgi:hypothetical protein
MRLARIGALDANASIVAALAIAKLDFEKFREVRGFAAPYGVHR